MFLWLHDRGYTVYNIGGLTYGEINLLSDAFERREKKRKRKQKQAARKARR